MTGPILITTDIDRTLIFSQRATSQLGGALPADAVETSASQVAGELCHAARAALSCLPDHARMCLATSRSLPRLARLRLPFPVHYAIAANGGVILIDGDPDQGWAARIRRELAGVAPAATVRALLARFAGSPWLDRLAEEDELCCLAIVDRQALRADQFAEVVGGCGELGWQASLVGRKLYAFPAGFGKESAVAFVAARIAQEAGAAPRRLAAGDTEHDRPMLAAADLAWAPAGSELAASDPGKIRITREPGHAAAAQIASEWLADCLAWGARR